MGKNYGGYQIDDSSLESFAESICTYVRISLSPGIKTGSKVELHIVLLELDKIMHEIERKLDGPALMKMCIPKIGELLYYCETNEDYMPDICFNDEEDALSSFEILLRLYVEAHYNEISYLIKRMDDGWRYGIEPQKHLKNGQKVLVELLDGSVQPATYKVRKGVESFYFKGENVSIYKWTPIVPPNWTVPNKDKEPPCFIPEENSPYPLCKGCGKEECNYCSNRTSVAANASEPGGGPA